MSVIEVGHGRTPSGKRSYTIGYKIDFLQQWDEQVTVRGGRARLCRENNVHWTTALEWVAARDTGRFGEAVQRAAVRAQNGKVSTRRQQDAVDRAKIARLEAENVRLRKKVEQAEAAQEILGKAFGLLQTVNESPTEITEPIPPALMSLDQYRIWLDQHGLGPASGPSSSQP